MILVAAGLLPAASVFGQDSLFISSHNKKVGLTTLGVYGVSLIGLNSLWYSEYEKSEFHSFNDNNQWLLMDKVGHFYSTYTLSALTYPLYKTGGKGSKQALLYSGGASFLFLTTVEILDGYSENWGFSWGDFIANTGGIALFVGQQYYLDQQLLRIKYSYQNTEYRKLRPNTFGETTLQSAFKDYNGQTYWASLNLNSVCSKIEPKWLNLAFGYGGQQMIFGNTEITEFEGDLYSPYRQYYLSLDIDWEQIETNKKVVKWIFRVANCIKLPAPALQFSKDRSVVFHGLYF